LDVVYQRLVRGMAPYNPPLSRDGIYRLTTEFGEDADMQMVSNTKSSSQDVLQQTLDQLTADEIDGSFFKLLRLSISNFPQKTDDEKEEMILLWEYLTYQACLAKEGQIFANPVDSQDMVCEILPQEDHFLLLIIGFLRKILSHLQSNF
jgi:hypothetical protein